MLLNKRNKQLAIAVITMGMALATFGLQYSLYGFMSVVRSLQILATALLFYAICKKDNEHKDKLLLSWLALTTILFFAYSFSFMEYFAEFFSYYPDFWFTLLMFACTGAGVVSLGFMMYLIYQDYVQMSLETIEQLPSLVSTRRKEQSVYNFPVPIHA